jgi:glycosyltransferase involved in cell wall biosynthesis
MEPKILIIQRFYYNFREGFFDFLYERNINFQLINATRSLGRVTVHQTAKNKPYIKNVPMFTAGLNYVIFPFLFFHLCFTGPYRIITEGGQNTINNLQVLLYHFITRKKYIVWDLGKGYDEFPNTFFRKIYMYFYKLTLKKAFWIYTYNSQGKMYFKSLGIDENKVLVLNNTVDTRKIKRIREVSSEIRPAELQFINDDHLTGIIFVGALLPSKNIEDLKPLMDLLGEKYFLIIVGDGESEYRSRLQKLFEHTPCKFVGYKKPDEIAGYYNMASFAVLPGLGGLSINQALAFGLPVICRSADGAEKDLIFENETGYIYSSLEDAARYIQSKTRDEWKKMGILAEKLIYTEHSLELMTDKFLSKLYSAHE